jgi:hypothetical protein
LVSGFDLVVPESEYDLYKKVVKNADNIKTIPDTYNGLGEVRNWVLDNYEDEGIIMLDDDIGSFYNLMNSSSFVIRDVDTIDQILFNAYQCALDSGCKLFSFNQKADVRKFSPHQPFSLNAWAGTVVGIIGRDLRFTEINKLKVDADYSLQSLLKHRIVWIDNRYAASPIRDKNAGGNSIFRTKELVDQENEFLREKWGKYIYIGSQKQTGLLRLKVERKQKLNF